MEWKIVKIGGSVLKHQEDFKKVVQVIKEYYQSPLVIVISALGGVTDMLHQEYKTHDNLINNLYARHAPILNLLPQKEKEQADRGLKELLSKLAGLLKQNPADQEREEIFSYGERLAVSTLHAVLQAEGITCRIAWPEEYGFLATRAYGKVSVDFTKCQEQVRAYFQAETIYIVPGYYGIGSDHNIMLFGRGGSDYSATALAYCLNTARVDMWKDVPGYLTGDPEVVPEPQPIAKLNYLEAAELAYFGSSILHPLTIEPVMKKNIPIWLYNFNSFNKERKPSTIIDQERCQKASTIKSLAYTYDCSTLGLNGTKLGYKPGILALITTTLSNYHINIKSVLTAQTNITLLLDQASLRPALEALAREDIPEIESIEACPDVGLLALVGEGITENHGLAARAFTAVSRHKINVKLICAGASPVAMYCIIDAWNVPKALMAVHQIFFGKGVANHDQKNLA